MRLDLVELMHLGLSSEAGSIFTITVHFHETDPKFLLMLYFLNVTR